MKFFGKKIEGRNFEWVVIPRPEKDLVFKAQAVLNMDRFKELCPFPKPPKKIIPGGKAIDDVEDEDFKLEVSQYGKKRYAYMFLESYRETEGLEWETIDYNNHNTWMNYEQELKDSGLTEPEIQQLEIGMHRANSIDQAKLDEARNRFLATLIQKEERLSLTAGQNTTLSGELANASG